MIEKKTKIVATIGPKTESVEMLTKLIKAGMNVARINMSHGDYKEQGDKIKNIREAEKLSGTKIAILFDLSGPKIRTGGYTTETITIETGKKIILTTEKIIGDEKRIHVHYDKLPQEVKKGMIIMLDDGRKRLQVEKISGTEVYCKILTGGILKARRGVNIPDASLSISSITAKDKKDLDFGVKQDIDFVAISFVRRKEDILTLRSLLKKHKKDLPIIAKIETREAMDNLDEILEVSDGLMVARGDLAAEVETEMVPIYQKDIIERCNLAGKPVITATQMLESMINSQFPTRAEVSDVANAIFDGTDAVMLSEETTLGHYPIEAVTVMSNVAVAAERKHFVYEQSETITDAISESVPRLANEVGAVAIVALTESGKTARMVSRFDPSVPIYALTSHKKTARELTLVCGVRSIEIEQPKNFDEAIELIPKILHERKIVKKGDKIILAAGVPFRKTGSTNMVLVLTC